MVKNLVIAALSAALLVSLAFHFVQTRGPGASVPESGLDPASLGGASHSPPDPQPEPGSVKADAIPPEKDERIEAINAILDEAESKPGMAGAVLGFCLLDPEGEVLYEKRSDLAQIPASSLKTLTTATALEVLGVDFCFETRLGVSAPEAPASGGSPGGGPDLILLGGGDPMLSLNDLEDWGKALVEAGMTKIPGRIIGDGRLFKGSSFADFWNWGDIGNGYGSPVSGLNLEHNRFHAIFAPAEKDGDPAVFVGALPEVPGVSWWNETVTAAADSGDGVVIHGGERASVVHLRGTVPLGGEHQVTGAVPDPERFAAHHLRQILLAAGVVVEGEAKGAGELFLAGEAVPEIAEELLLHRSPPLLEIVKSIHETSDNHETECLFRTLGVRTGMAPEEAVRSHWSQRGLDLSGLRLVDGSGLARADHITPRTLASLQHLASTGPAGEVYVNSLLTLADGRIRFKAGAMSAVRSYAGLVDSEKGRLAFALMVNHYADGGEVGELQGLVFSALGKFVPEP